MTPPEDLDLLQAYLDGTLPPADRGTVEARLKAEPALADALVRLGREEAILTEWARTERAMEPFTPSLPFRRPHVPVRVAWLGLAGAAAAVLLITALATLVFHGPASAEPPVAEVEEVEGEVFILTPQGQLLPANPGQELVSGQGLQTRGNDSAAVLRYPDRSRLELGADTVVRLVSEAVTGKKVNLSEGVVTADVVKQPAGQPMVLTTPHVEVRAQETRFSSTSLGDRTRIDPETGWVQVTRRSDGASVDMTSGSYLVASLGDDVPGLVPFVAQPLPSSFKKPRAVLRDGTGPIQAAAVSPDGTTIATGGWDGAVRLWRMVPPGRESTFLGVRWGSINVTPSQAQGVLRGFNHPVRTLAFSPDGLSLAAASDEKKIRLWDLESGVERDLFKAWTTALTYTPDGTLVSAGGAGKAPTEVRLWSEGQAVPILTNVNREATCVAASPDGKFLAVGFPNGTVHLWDLKAHRELKTLPAHTREVRCLAFSPDGHILATGSRDQTVWLWNTDTWTTRDVLPAHPGEVKVVAFSPDGQTLVSGGGNGMLKVWNLATGEEVTTFRADKNAVCGLAFSPDGQTLVTAGWDRTAKLWNTAGPQ